MTGQGNDVPGRERGFTLIELAIVLFILALLFGGLLAPLSVRLEQAERNDTERHLQEIREALYGFALVERRLPCPDCPSATGTCAAVPVTEHNDGREDRPGGVCASADALAAFAVGNLPWADLGMPEADPWGRRFAYGVTRDFADDTDGTGCSGNPHPGVSFELCSNGGARILAAAGGNVLVEETPAVVISFGANGSICPTSAHESENWIENRSNTMPACGLPVNSDFVQKSYSREAAQEFDDMLTWLATGVLMNRMIVAGLLP